MEKREVIRQFYLLQVNDALFPIGAYSHSQGLETYILKGMIHDEKTAEIYIRQKLKQSLLYTELLGACLAYKRAKAGDMQGLSRLEEVLEASRIPMEQREASRKMGSRFAKTVGCLPLEEDGNYTAYLRERQGKTMSHCCIYGVFCAAIGVELEETLSHYLYAQTSAMVTNCVKTIPLSQSVGQKLLSTCFEKFPELLQKVQSLAEDDLCLSAPGFDIRGIQHERLYSRLYMS